jgi:hypothetical protein
MNWKGYRRKQPRPNLKCCPPSCLMGAEENHKKPHSGETNNTLNVPEN